MNCWKWITKEATTPKKRFVSEHVWDILGLGWPSCSTFQCRFQVISCNVSPWYSASRASFAWQECPHMATNRDLASIIGAEIWFLGQPIVVSWWIEKDETLVPKCASGCCQTTLQVRPDRQTLMWSATWPESVRFPAESPSSSELISGISQCFFIPPSQVE